MKVFISAISVLLILTSFITLNAIHLSDFTDTLIEKCKSLPASAENADAGRLIDIWLKNSWYVNLTVDHRTTNQIEIVLYQLEHSAANCDQLEYEADLRTLLTLLNDMKCSVSASPSRIL